MNAEDGLAEPSNPYFKLKSFFRTTLVAEAGM
jgi:hypothetical protein